MPINFNLDEIKKKILTINNKYNFFTLKGQNNDDDVLIAYIYNLF
jgi:hypothetical protein